MNKINTIWSCKSHKQQESKKKTLIVEGGALAEGEMENLFDGFQFPRESTKTFWHCLGLSLRENLSKKNSFQNYWIFFSSNIEMRL